MRREVVATLPAVLAALRQLARLPLPPDSCQVRQVRLLDCVSMVPMGRLMLLAECPAGWRHLDLVQRCLVGLLFCSLPNPARCPWLIVVLALSQESGAQSQAAAVLMNGLLNQLFLCTGLT